MATFGQGVDTLSEWVGDGRNLVHCVHLPPSSLLFTSLQFVNGRGFLASMGGELSLES